MNAPTSLGTLHVGAGLDFGPLTVFPVWTDAPVARGISTATTADVQVSELDPPTVPRLIACHNLDHDVLLLEGTMLVGGNQTRVAACDVLIPRGERLVIDVRCVEAGRWHGGHRYGVDGKVPASVKAALRGGARRGATADQSEVWAKVARLERSYGAKPTSSLHEVLNDSLAMSEFKNLDDQQRREAMAAERRKRANAGVGSFAGVRADDEQSFGADIPGVDADVLERLRHFAKHPLPGQRGIIIGIGGVPVSLEMYASAATCRAELLSTLMAALVDAGSIRYVGPTRGQAARDFAAHVMKASYIADVVEVAESTQGASETLRGGDDFIDIRALQRSDTKTLLHFSALNMQHELALAL